MHQVTLVPFPASDYTAEEGVAMRGFQPTVLSSCSEYVSVTLVKITAVPKVLLTLVMTLFHANAAECIVAATVGVKMSLRRRRQVFLSLLHMNCTSI